MVIRILLIFILLLPTASMGEYMHVFIQSRYGVIMTGYPCDGETELVIEAIVGGKVQSTSIGQSICGSDARGAFVAVPDILRLYLDPTNHRPPGTKHGACVF